MSTMKNGEPVPQPTISVVIPTFDSALFLVETLDSVLSQDYPNVEILVIDDGSTDNTTEVLEPYRDRIKYFKQPNWGGPSRPRNVGIQNATGEFIAFFDSDDLMLPGKLSRSASALIEHPDLDFVFTNFQGVGESGQVIRENYLEDYRNFRNDLEAREPEELWSMPGSETFTHLISANFIGTSSVLCRKSVFDKVGLMDETLLNADDANMWGRIAHAGFRFAFLDAVLHSYRMRSGGVTGRREKRYPAILKSITQKLGMDLTPTDRAMLEEKHYRLQLGYARALREVGQYSRARNIYCQALGKKTTWAGIKGWAGTLVAPLLKNAESTPNDPDTPK